ncbi:MAG: hypothetical protein AAGK71_01095 [Pseudomonadota bacterium]
MKLVLLSAAIVVGSMGTALAEHSAAPSMGPTVLFHDAETDENGCHVAKRKRHNFHCHEAPQPEIRDELDVTKAPTDDNQIASASE